MLNSLEYQFNSTLEKHGHDIKINNQDARVIMKSVNNEFDDKEILTKFNIRQGMYVFYNGEWFMITTQVNDTRQNVYNKATIRRCDHIINFIIDDKLYGFPVVFTTSEMVIRDNQLLVTRDDFLKVQIPASSVSRKIQLLDRILKFDSAWEVTGKNETRRDIVELSLTATQINGIRDDEINEIADRWEQLPGGGTVDKLNGNTTPIMPFDDEDDVLSNALVTLFIIDNVTGEKIDTIIEITDSNDNKLYLIANEPYLIAKGTYTYQVEEDDYILETGTFNIESNTSEIILLSPIVEEEPEPEPEPEGDTTYLIEVQTALPDDDPYEIWYTETLKHIVHKFVDDVEVEGNFTFELDSTQYATITDMTNNSCDITGGSSVFGINFVKLIVTDIDTGEVAIERNITIVGR